MRAFFNPGPSYFNPQVRRYAGWLKVYDLMKEALGECGYEVRIPNIPEELIDTQTTVGKITSWDILSASQLPKDVHLFVGPPGYSLSQMLLLKNIGAKIICLVFNNADWWRDRQLAEEYKRLGWPYDLSPTWRWINTTALETCDRVIACSPWVKWTHGKVVPEEKISMALWGVDSKKFTPAEKEPEGCRVLFSGGDPVRKGLPYLIDAFSKLAIAGETGLELWIVGCQVELGGIGFPVRQFGMTPHDQMLEIMRQCHVICIPTLEDGIACALQEGMASGLVPIATPEAAEVFQDPLYNPQGLKVGIQVDYRNVEQIAEALRWLKNNPDERRAMAARSRELAEKQTWEMTKNSFKEIIRRECGIGG